MKQRIWELDAFRGICILGVIIIHTVFDLTTLYGLVDWTLPAWFQWIQQWGGILFILLSGICATLGRHHLKRGAAVLLCGLLVTAVTAGMVLLGLADPSLIIYFGVLHCLGVCMLSWELFRRLPTAVLGPLGAVMAVAGLILLRNVFELPHFLVIFGFLYPGFSSSDYFPLLPYLGFFLVGAAMGRTLYAKRVSLLPAVDPGNPVIRFLTFCGRQSLWIYLLHQPLLAGLFYLLA